MTKPSRPQLALIILFLIAITLANALPIHAGVCIPDGPCRTDPPPISPVSPVSPIYLPLVVNDEW